MGKVVRETEYYKEVIMPRENELQDLINNGDKKDAFLNSLNLDDFTGKTYNKLKSEYDKYYVKRNKYRKSMLKKVTDRFFVEDILNDVESYFLVSKAKLLKFNKELTYLIFFDKISLEETKTRGFDPEYIESLLQELKIDEDPYVHFFVYKDTNERQNVTDYQKTIGIRK